MKEKLIAYLQLIWPTIYRIINNGIYWLFTLIRSTLRIARDQLRGM